ncbi:MAG: peptidase M50 [Limisphaerales bacterium]
MADTSRTFSESWHRIAEQRICLHSAVRTRRQWFRGELWIILENPFNNQFFRLRPASYEFIARLQPDRTVQEAWEQCLERFPDDAPGQEAVIQLLAQLYHANLLQYGLASDSKQLFERQRKRRQRETRARWLNIMFLRIPLLDPDVFLKRTLPLIGWLFSWIGALLWIVVVGMAGKVALDHFPELSDQTQSILSPSNIPLLYLALVITKVLHEFGHAYLCRKYGGEVHTMGVMLLIFTPIPYVDATSSWSLRSRAQRILVASGGMLVEVFVAAIATFIWANTAPGTLHNLAYNMMFVASVSTLVFNINPLLRFDGYYILSDLLDIPNLHQRSSRQLRHFFESHLFGLQKSESPARSLREGFWLTTFAITSGIYRVIVFGGILLFVADRFLLLGILMTIVCAMTWVLIPVGKLAVYLASSPALERNRPRAILATLALAAVILGLLQGIPFPNRFRAPGILQATERSVLITETPGQLTSILATPGEPVSAGQELARLTNPELEWSLAAAYARRTEVEHRIRQALREQTANLKPLEALLTSIQERVNKLERDQANLVLRAKHNGIWINPEVRDYVGRWLPRGTSLGLVVNGSSFEFRATVRQADVNYLFAHGTPAATIRLHGQAGTPAQVDNLLFIPASQVQLPSKALGWTGGGEMPVNPRDPEGRTTLEPFFELRAEVEDNPNLTLLHGRTGKVRLEVEPQPILTQLYRRLRQLLQQRYQL